ncbi:hypothetical protein D5S17_21420 [Pseudonocardiaceae bacterium YIM PH 21723]|nr:hypothetical protein D5S17_21420 [Pseudonocardiaceae bacterium YIM PH 21723]
MTMVACLLPLLAGAVPTATAAATDLRLGTWNMNGSVGNDSNQDGLKTKAKWLSVIPGLMRSQQLRALALQEHADNWSSSLDNVDGTVDDVETNGEADLGTGDPTTVADADDRYSTSPRSCTDRFVSNGFHPTDLGKTIYTHKKIVFTAQPGKTYHLYLLKTLNADRTLATITDQEASACRIMPMHISKEQLKASRFTTRGEYRKETSTRPAFGVKIGDSWIYNVHADSDFGMPNDTSQLLEAVSSVPGDHFAMLGDFNTRLEDLSDRTTLDDGEAAIASTKPTYKVGRSPTNNYDYMIANGLPPGTPHIPPAKRDGALHYTGFRQTFITNSDHYPVVFRDEADQARREAGEDRCAPATAPGTRLGAKVTPFAEECPVKPPAIVSMGDSYISGEAGRWAGNANTPDRDSVWGTDRGMASYVDNTGYQGGNGCDRSDIAEIKGADIAGIPPDHRFNLACSGALTQHVAAEKFKGEDPQVTQLERVAAANDVRLITVSMGGNDLGFSDVVASCASNYLNPVPSEHCNTKQWAALQQGLATTRPKVTATLGKVIDTMTRLGYDRDHYRLVLQSYPAPMPAGPGFREKGETYQRYSRDGCPFYNDDATWAHDTVIPAIADMLHTAAQSVGADFLDLRDAFAGHELCATTAGQATAANSAANPLPAANAEWARWVPQLVDLPWIPAQPNRQGAKQEAIHPNAFGQQALSACLTQFAATPVGTSSQCVGAAGLGPDKVHLGKAGDPAPTPGRPIDGAVTLNDRDVYLFHGPTYARVEGGIHVDGGVKSIYDTWPALRGTRFTSSIDGGFTRPGDPDVAYLFSGDRYVALRLGRTRAEDRLLDGPGRIADRWPALRGTGFETGIDAAFADGRARDTGYLIKGDKAVDLRFAPVGEFDPGATTSGTIRGTGEFWPTLKRVDSEGTAFTKKIDAAFGFVTPRHQCYPPGAAQKPLNCPTAWSESVFVSEGKLVRLGKLSFRSGRPGNESLESGPTPICEAWKALCGTLFAPGTQPAGEDGRTPGQPAAAPVTDHQAGELRSATGLVATPGTAAGTPVTGSSGTAKAGKDDRRWIFHDNGDDNWLLETQQGDRAGHDFMLDMSPARQVDLADYRPAAQGEGWRFRAVGGGWFNLVANNDGSCLTAVAAGKGLVTADCTGTDAQRWQPFDLSAALPPSTEPTSSLVSKDGVAVDLDFGDRTPGTKIQSRKPKDWWPQPQGWFVRDQGNDTWLIETGYGGSKMLAKTTDGHTELAAYQEGALNQRWWVTIASEPGWLLLVNHEGGCLTSSAIGEPLQVTPCTTASAQKWHIVTGTAKAA